LEAVLPRHHSFGKKKAPLVGGAEEEIRVFSSLFSTDEAAVPFRPRR